MPTINTLADEITHVDEVMDDIRVLASIMDQELPRKIIIVNQANNNYLRPNETGFYDIDNDSAYIKSARRYHIIARTGHEIGHKNAGRKVQEEALKIFHAHQDISDANIRNIQKGALETLIKYEMAAIIDHFSWHEILTGNTTFNNYSDEMKLYLRIGTIKKSFYDEIFPITTSVIEKMAIQKLKDNKSIN